MADVMEPGAENVILENLEEIYSELNSIFNSHSQRLLEFKVVVSEGVKRAQEAIQVQHNRVLDLLKSNAELSRQAGVDYGSLERFANLQTELKQQIDDLSGVNDGLGADIDRLTGEKNDLSQQKKDAISASETITTDIGALNTQLDHLERDNDALKKEKVSLEKEKNRLQTEVDRLRGLKDEYLASIARYREIKGGLMT